MTAYEVRRQCADRFLSYLRSSLYDHTATEFEQLFESILGPMADYDPIEERLKVVAHGLLGEQHYSVILGELEEVRKAARREEREEIVNRLMARARVRATQGAHPEEVTHQ